MKLIAQTVESQCNCVCSELNIVFVVSYICTCIFVKLIANRVNLKNTLNYSVSLYCSPI